MHTGALCALLVALTASMADCERRTDKACGVEYSSGDTIMNWSGTHSCQPGKVYEPKSAQEVLRLLRHLQDHGIKARPIGSALSPNGIGMGENLISLAGMDYVEVDPVRRTVTAGAGARVSQVLRALDQHSLTLANFSSIQEQTVAGWTAVSAHGTGSALPPVDSMVLRMQMATPQGLLTLSPSDGHLFEYAKVSLGALGVVTQLTLSCVPQHLLDEQTYTTSLQQLRQDHSRLLSTYRHVRYMWMPYTSEVVVVVSNPRVPDTHTQTQILAPTPAPTPRPTHAMEQLLQELSGAEPLPGTGTATVAGLREALLAHGPLDLALVQRINQAEASYWSHASSRSGDSAQILGFDCGGEQLVYEVAVPVPVTGLRDLDFMEKLLTLIEQAGMPAPCPIEQRWTAASTSPMSPAHSNSEEVFTWVGIIHYLPAGLSPEQRQQVRRAFDRYIDTIQPLVEEYKGHAHWAKIELPSDAHSDGQRSWWEYLMSFISPVPSAEDRLRRMRSRIRERYPVQEFNALRRALDPKGVLANDTVRALFDDEEPAK